MDYDLTKGRIVEKTEIIHHAAVDGVLEVGHYETIIEYPNGGKDVVWIVDIPAVASADAYDEEKISQVYIPYTAAELAAIEENRKPSIEERTSALESALLELILGGVV